MAPPSSLSVTVDSLPTFFAQIDAIWMDWCEKRSGTLTDIWFRGHRDKSWPLMPGALRPQFSGLSEHRLRHEFQMKSRPFLSEVASAPLDRWEWYFLMQHYGIPTRLLDWTESAAVALHFALEDSTSANADVDACVWILEPRSLNEMTETVGPHIPIYSSAKLGPYLPDLWEVATELRGTNPVAIDPPSNSPRITAQKGKFTIHCPGIGNAKWKGKLGDSLKRVVIPKKFKERFRRQLMLTGIDESTLFPGLSGLSAEITRCYSRTWQLEAR